MLISHQCTYLKLILESMCKTCNSWSISITSPNIHLASLPNLSFIPITFLFHSQSNNGYHMSPSLYFFLPSSIFPIPTIFPLHPTTVGGQQRRGGQQGEAGIRAGQVRGDKASWCYCCRQQWESTQGRARSGGDARTSNGDADNGNAAEVGENGGNDGLW